MRLIALIILIHSVALADAGKRDAGDPMAYWGYFAFPPAMIAAYALRERLIHRKNNLKKRG